MRKAVLRYFRSVRPENVASSSLETMLRRSLGQFVDGTKVLDSWKLREWTDTDYVPTKVTLANHVRPSRDNIFGDLLAMRPGQLDMVLDTGGTGREAATRVMPASNNVMLIRSSMFWLVDDDDVVICSSGLQISAYEKYMTWLLRSHSNLGNAHIKLRSTVDVSNEDLRSIKEIVLGDKLVVHPGPKTEKKAQKHHIDLETLSGVRRAGKLRSALQALFGTAAEADAILDRVPADREVSWRFSFKFLRPTAEESREALEEAYRMAAARDDGIDVMVQTKHGQVKADSLLLQEEAQIAEQRDGMLDRDDVLAKMQAVLHRWRQMGRLD